MGTCSVKCWGGGGCAWTRQWFFVLGWRGRMGSAVVSGDQRVLWGEQSRAVLKAFLFITPLATHARLQLAVSRFS